MQYFLRILRFCVSALRRVAAFLTGFAGKTWRRPWVFHVCHYLLVAIVTIVLGYYSTRLNQQGWFPDVNLPLVNKFYLAVQFLLVYAAVRLLILVVRLLLMRDTSEFEDIERAWRIGVQELDFFNVDLSYTPLFLVLGLPRSDEAGFFAASKLRWLGIAPQPQEEAAAPIRFYFNEEAVYVTCPAVGSLAEQNLKNYSAPSLSPPGSEPRIPQGYGDSSQTLNPATSQHQLSDHQSTEDTIPPGMYVPSSPILENGGGMAGATMMPTQSPFATQFARPDQRAGLDLDPTPRRAVRLTQDEIDRQQRRLEFLCELIRDRRREHSGAAGHIAPINGVMTVLPLEHTKSNVGFVGPAECLATDLKTLVNCFQLAFPVVAVETNLDHIDGLDTFLDRVVHYESEILNSRAGSRFPCGHPVTESDANWLVDRGLDYWFRGWIYMELSNDVSDRTNRRLYRFACNLLERRERLVRQMDLAFSKCAGPEAVRLAGLYFCSNGSTPEQQAFVHGVFQKMIDVQGDLAWTTPQIAADQRASTMAKLVYLACCAVLAVGGWVIWKFA
jgi:hypothetical protein